MANIRIMNDLLANKIAAGEVVERPASVVKELVENALDAGATEIDIELLQSGLEYIRVTDNGSGIASKELPIAFERHATSKIQEDKDLFRISTLGFRGEALPSIAAVSRTEIRTRTEQETGGTFLRLEGGKMQETGAIAAKVGTELIVRDLFFNTPARLKYLKSMQTELSHSINYIEKMSFAHPDVSFRLSHNDRTLVHTPGDGNLLHAVTAVYGRDTAKQMVPLKWENYDYRLKGLVGYPELNRANRNHCTFFVNGRYIKSFQLINALQAAYHTRLPINRYPVCVLHLELDPSLVDVNVHPSKLEVRFSEEKDVFTCVQTAVQSALQNQTFIPNAYPHQSQNQLQSKNREEKSVQSEFTWQKPIRIQYESRETTDQIRESQLNLTKSVDQGNKAAALDLYRPAVHDTVLTGESHTSPTATESANMENQNEADPKVPLFRPVAQVLGMYIIAENEQGLYIIDQHAAHEKVLYEKFMKRINEKQVHPLPMLVPLTIELAASEAQKLEKQLPLLAEFQIEIEGFGGESFLIRSVPDIWSGLDIQRLASEFIDEFLEDEQVKDPRTLIENKIITKACKAAIKANHWLSMPEMVALCDQLSELENPFNCPHGRPIIIHMSAYDLEKQFKRVM